MFTDKFKSEDDVGYLDKYNCYYDSFEDFVQSGLLKFCGCGSPEDNLKYVMNGLGYIDSIPNCLSDYVKFKKDLDNWNKEALDIFGNDSSKWFFYYWADSVELVEHGACLPGWLTYKGKELLSDLKEYFENKNE